LQLLLALMGAWWASAAAQEPGAELLVSEYFVRQEAAQPLVIRVNPFEAEFQVFVRAPNGELLLRSELPGNRTQPVFLYVDGAARERQLDIRVDASLFTRHTRFDLEFYRLDLRDELSERLARSYQLLSGGQEVLAADTAANWSVRINMLIQSARLFETFGMEELRLWAWLAAAHLSHFELGDSNTALDWTGEVSAAARLSALPGPAFSAQVLRGEILFGLAGRENAGAVTPTEARAALADTTRLAGLVGNAYEQAWALFLHGEMLADEGQHGPALEQYQQALKLAEQRQATALAAEVRKQMVTAHETLGDVVATEQALGRMVEELAGGGAETELVKGLLAQGQLYLDLFRYPDAEAALIQALEIDKVSLTRTHASILLGRAQYESGRLDEAIATLTDALANPQSGLFRRPNPLLPLASGLEALAASYRQMGRHDEARRTRLVLRRHLELSGETARWSRQRMLDELRAGRLPDAVAAYREYGALLRAEADGIEGALALLSLCAAGAAGQDTCHRNTIETALARTEGGDPRQVLDARLQYARIIAREGRSEAAEDAYRALLSHVHFYQAELTGVLGAWFWENRIPLFRGSLAALTGPGPIKSLSSFTALARILAIGRAVGHFEGDDALRSAIAGRDPGWKDQVRNRQVQFQRTTSRFDDLSIQRWLEQLSGDEAVLAWVHEPDGIHSWLARAGVVRYQRLSSPPGFESVLSGLADTATPGMLARAGSVLLERWVDDLPGTVYWLPAGRLLGADPNGFIIRDQRLGANRTVIALTGFPAPGKPALRLGPAWPQRVFLAGDPSDWTRAVPERLTVSAEMDAVRTQFAGPALHMIQGNALLLDEFEDQRLRAADLVHLALPAIIDLATPAGSKLELSEPGRGAGRQTIGPGDLRENTLGADLVVLGQARFLNESQSDYDSRLGLVTDLIESGARGVLVCRPNEAEANARFMRSLYRSLAEDGDMAGAVRDSFSDDGVDPGCQIYSP
jgi:tetratricopeptide (TPR) repeat protein